MVVATQTKGFRIINYHGPPTPLGAKARRIRSTFILQTVAPPLPDPPYRYNSMDEVVECHPAPSSPAEPSTTVLATIARESAGVSSLKASYDALEEECQLLRQSYVQQNQEGKTTPEIYRRHLENYQVW